MVNKTKGVTNQRQLNYRIKQGGGVSRVKIEEYLEYCHGNTVIRGVILFLQDGSKLVIRASDLDRE